MKKCILCNSDKYKTLLQGKNWQIVKCNKCELVKTERNIENASYDFYHRDETYKKLESHFKNIFQTRVNLAKKHIETPGKVLDVGCSNGTMLDIFKSDGWETWGVEPSENAEIAIDKGHKVFQTLFEKVNFTGKFNIIIMNHTLEHLEDPLSVVKKAYSLLEKDGILLVDVPNFDSLSSRLMGKYWPHLLPLEHNFQFTRKTLEKTFEKVGFSIVDYKTRSGIFEFANPVQEVKESLFGMKKRFISRVINFPYDILAMLLNRGDSMSVVGRRVK
ncbi:MAG: class I SAM-dependent methyltransferase [Patescibacteria group bacterium]